MTESTSATLVAFDLIGVLVEPSWRELAPAPDLALWRRLKVGALAEPDFWDERTAAAYRACLRVRADRLALLARVRARGCRIAVASNFARAWAPVVRALLPDPSVVDHWFISGELGVAKPAAGFWTALRRHVPAGSLVVDDQRRNCEAATRAGLRGLWAPAGAPLAALVDAALAISSR